MIVFLICISSIPARGRSGPASRRYARRRAAPATPLTKTWRMPTAYWCGSLVGGAVGDRRRVEDGEVGVEAAPAAGRGRRCADCRPAARSAAAPPRRGSAPSPRARSGRAAGRNCRRRGDGPRLSVKGGSAAIAAASEPKLTQGRASTLRTFSSEMEWKMVPTELSSSTIRSTAVSSTPLPRKRRDLGQALAGIESQRRVGEADRLHRRSSRASRPASPRPPGRGASGCLQPGEHRPRPALAHPEGQGGIEAGAGGGVEVHVGGDRHARRPGRLDPGQRRVHQRPVGAARRLEMVDLGAGAGAAG